MRRRDRASKEPTLDKGGKCGPAEVKNQSNQGRKRALLKTKDSEGPEAQPPPFSMGLTCQNTSCSSVSEHIFFPALSELPFLTGANAWSLPTFYIRSFGYFQKMLLYKCLKTQVIGMARLFGGVRRTSYLYFRVDWNPHPHMRNFKHKTFIFLNSYQYIIIN